MLPPVCLPEVSKQNGKEANRLPALRRPGSRLWPPTIDEDEGGPNRQDAGKAGGSPRRGRKGYAKHQGDGEPRQGRFAGSPKALSL